MLTKIESCPLARTVNCVVDSLYLRILRQCIPSDWLKRELPKWREFQATADFETKPYLVFLRNLGTFELKAFGKQPYAFILVNKEVGRICVWNPDKWESAISSQTGQFFVEFRSKYLQTYGLPGVRSFVKNLCKLLTVSLTFDVPYGWERISRIDLATDTQTYHPPQWDDLRRYVSRSRKNEGDSDSIATELEQSLALLRGLISSPPPHDNKGGATYNLSSEQVDLLRRTLESVKVPEVEDGYVYRLLHTKNLQTIYFGRFASALCGVRYDKLATLELQKKQYLKEVWKANGWDGHSPVWRTEFRLKGPFLAEAGLLLDSGEKLQDLRDFSTFCRHLPKVWQYLTRDWLRLTIPSETDSNQWRWALDPEWEIIQNAMFSQDKIKRYPRLRNPIDAQMTAQMRGVALTLAARRAEWDCDGEAAIAVLNDLATWFAEDEFDRRLAERRSLLGCDDFTHAAFADEMRAEWLLEGEGS